MKINKVGDCLTYGLVHEMYNHMREKKFDYLKAVIVFLILNGYIDRDKTVFFKEVFGRIQIESIDSMTAVEKVLSKIVGSLKGKFLFGNHEELVTELNHYTIPKWMYDNGKLILGLLPEVYLVDKSLYYIEKKNGHNLFRCQEIEQIGKASSYNIYDEEFEDDEDVGIISDRYSSIIAFNDKVRVFYLKLTHMDEMYVEYNVDSKKEVIKHKNCLGVIGGRMPVVIENKSLSVIVGDWYQCIKERNPFEDYRVKGNEIYVIPRRGVPIVFKPYVLTLTGQVMKLPYNEVKDYLWNKILQSIFPSFDLDEEEQLDVDVVEILKRDKQIFSLKYIEDFLNDESLTFNKNGRILLFIVNTLGKYLDREEDVLDYFYAIAEAARRYEEVVVKNVLSENVYWRLEEMEINGELEKCIHDLDRFSYKLNEHVYWNDERIMEHNWDTETGKVGGFEILNNRVKMHAIPLGEGACMGSVIVMPEVFKEGMVTYNIGSGMFEIQYSRELDRAELDKIVEGFALGEKRYRYFVESIN